MMIHRKRALLWGGLGLAVVLVLMMRGAFFTVRPDEQVLVLEFGRIVRGPIDRAGLHVKNPFTHRVVRLEKRLIAWDGDPNRMPTRDKKNIFVDVYARWRIADARLFYTSLGTLRDGQKKLDDLVDGAVRDVVSSHDLIEVVRLSNRELVYGADSRDAGLAPEQTVRIETGRKELEALIRRNVAQTLLEKFGMDLVDVRIKRVNYVKSVQDEVYARMKSERERIALRLKSEAQEDRARILGETKKDVAIIEGEAEQESARLIGEGDAKAIAVYAEAVNQAPEFYAFLRSLEAYAQVIDGRTTLVLTTDSPFLKTLKQTNPIAAPPGPAARPGP